MCVCLWSGQARGGGVERELVADRAQADIRAELLRDRKLPVQWVEANLPEIKRAATTPVVSRPNLLAKAQNLGRNMVTHVADGGRIASPEIQAERKAICQSNRCGLYDAASDGCWACGCSTRSAANWIGLNMETKRGWASSACPARPSLWEAA